MKIYIAGPMSGFPELNFPLFNATAQRLRSEGHFVVSPAEINIPHPGDWLSAMRADIKELVSCEAIYLLDGWSKSRGASLEYHIAFILGMIILFDGVLKSRFDYKWNPQGTEISRGIDIVG